MNIAIDLVGTDLGSGTKTYNLNFLKKVSKFNTENTIYIFCCKNYIRYIDFDFLPKNIFIKTKPNFYSKNFFKLFWMQILFPFELFILKIDKLFSPMNYCPIICKIMKTDVILGIHSNLPWVLFNKMPGNKLKNYCIKYLMTLSIRVSNKLLVNSNFAKNEITNLLNLKKNKVHVVYLGIDPDEEKEKLEQNIQKNLKLDNLIDRNKYILSVSSCVRYHEFLNMLKSYKNILNTSPEKIKFIFVMQILDQKYYEEIKKFVSLNFEKNEVVFLNKLDKKKLNKLYQNALFYIFSSYTEVFGLTTLEAMKNNCPVMVSNTSALPEINNNSAVYFDPDDISDIQNKMQSLIKNKNLRNNLKLSGKKNIQKFNWSKTFDETISIILN